MNTVQNCMKNKIEDLLRIFLKFSLFFEMVSEEDVQKHA